MPNTARSTAVRWAIGLLIATPALSYLHWTASGRLAPPPPDQSGWIRAGLTAVRLGGARERLPGRVEAIEADLRSAEAELSGQLARWWVGRDLRPVRDRLAEIHQRALNLQAELRHSLDQDRESARTALRSTSYELEDLRRLGRQSGLTSRQNQLMAQAEICFGQAQTLFDRGHYRPAAAAAGESLQWILLGRGELRQALARYVDPDQRAWWTQLAGRAIDISRRQHIALLVIKELRTLHVYERGRLTRRLAVDIGANSLNRKLYAGDRATPEGWYRVSQKKGRGLTRYHLALLIDYPNPDDRARYLKAQGAGRVPAGAAIGGLIEIHGHGGRGYDWTDGCVAPDDRDMQWLFERVSVGTAVAIIGADPADSPLFRLLSEDRR